jgi:hypothetical protein
VLFLSLRFSFVVPRQTGAGWLFNNADVCHEVSTVPMAGAENSPAVFCDILYPVAILPGPPGLGVQQFADKFNMFFTVPVSDCFHDVASFLCPGEPGRWFGYKIFSMLMGVTRENASLLPC